MDFVKAKLISDLSDEEVESPKNSQPNSEASEEFTPATNVIKVNFYLKTKMVWWKCILLNIFWVWDF